MRTLRAAGEPVRAASRSGEVRFDWTDPDTWPAVLAGVSAVYLVAPDDPAPIPDFVKQAVQAGVGRFVALSARGLDHISEGAFQGMATAERAVRDSGVQWTIIRPNNFSQNFSEDLWHATLRSGRLALPTGAVPEPFIDAQDIADVAAVLLTSDGHHEQVYDISGPQAFTFGEAVATIAKAAGREIDYVELTPAEYQAELRAAGVPEAFVSELDALFTVLRAGHNAKPADGVRQVLGRDPVDFAGYVSKAVDAWT
ncbi:uncharacterized protein YbjT (DUF2867 family) [Actinocrispum wychmicini]|uniref:Uncharacterized protein YbjT (DUF2867 family) n=1 Tax=Actinocrispum wychmicini TaxID=1213861 RepID=A0A4R2K7X5_9PSEU|nr:uncharacterized protein YbjT (DUF2867 family) [Actinocrispum wychmicini]